MEKPTIENLNALANSFKLNSYQRSLANNELERFKDYVGHLEKQLALFSVSNNEVVVCDKCETDFIHKVGVFRVCDNCGNRWVAN